MNALTRTSSTGGGTSVDDRLAAALRHGFLQNLAVRLETNGGNEATLLAAEQISRAPDFEVAHR